MPFTPAPPLAQRGDRATFSDRVDGELKWLTQTLVTEITAFEQNITALAAGGAISLAYTFSAATADTDPGTGRVSLSASPQNTSTVLRLDTVSGGQDISALLDTFDQSTSAIKGTVRLVKASNLAKWMVLSITARAVPTGYRNFTVSVIASSDASPFSDGDGLVMYYQRNGDAGTVASAYRYIAGSTVTSTAPFIDFLTVFTSDCDKYVIEMSNFQVTATSNLCLQLATAGTLNSTLYSVPSIPNGQVTTTANAARSVITANTLNATQTQGPITIEISNVNDPYIKTIAARGLYIDATNSYYNNLNVQGFWDSGGNKTVSGFRLFPSSGSFSKAKVAIYGIKNSG